MPSAGHPRFSTTLTDVTETTPLGKNGGTVGLEDIATGEAAFVIEVI